MSTAVPWMGVWALGLVIGLTFPSTPARAAQNARVAVEGATIRQSADSGSQILAEIPRGQVVRVGNNPQNGWYKVLIPGQRGVGYMEAAQLDLGPMAPAPPPGGRSPRERRRESDEDRSRQPWDPGKAYILGFSQFNFVAGIDTATVQGDSFASPTFGLQLGIRAAPQWVLGGYLGTFKFTTSDGTGYTGKGTQFAAFGEHDFSQSPKFSFSGSLHLGLSSGMTVGAIANKAQLTSASFSAVFALLTATARFRLASAVSLVGQLGYRILSKSSIPLSTTVAIDMNLSAPFVGLGLQVDL